MSVVAGVRSCSLTVLSPKAFVEAAALWAKAGLTGLPLGVEGLPNKPYVSTPSRPKEGDPIAFRVVVGKPEVTLQFQNAWNSNDHGIIGALLGYPPCCRDFFENIWVEQCSVDTTWAMAINTPQTEQDERTIRVSGPSLANILWRWMGVRSVPHLPCRFDCAPTIKLGEMFQEVGRDAGYFNEMEWAKDVLSWPVEWSALHGIAEVKTPILKVSTRTDATPMKLVVRYKGGGFPKEGATGLGFPYGEPSRLLITGSSGFQRGLRNEVHKGPSSLYWLYRDNGFSSLNEMDKAHRPIVQLARDELRGVQGNILDLGCGNGALLKRIWETNSSLVPYGIDAKAESIRHAKELLPQFAGNFVHGNFFDPSSWPVAHRYAFAMIMAGRLLEVRKEEAERLLEVLRSKCNRLLVYVYQGWSNHSFESIVKQTSLRLLKMNESNVGMVDLEKSSIGTETNRAP
jgi:2-polyprenyl-3-methyl-5-hydroxy-6-metoxy-1,4-benzoquinol methylase